MKKLFVRNKVMFVIIIILLICFILIMYNLIKYFYSGNKNAYGDRLENVVEHKLDNNIEENVSTLYSESKEVGEVKVELRGKIIYITIDFVKAIKLEDAKSLTLKSLEAFSQEEKEFYDIQYILTAKTIAEDESFPTMGYKNALSTVVVWINN